MKKAIIYSLVENKITSYKEDVIDFTKEEHPVINIFDIENTNILGFGGAITEASAYNYSLLSKEEKNKVLELLFGENGLKYRLLRLCIGSSDFSLNVYSYLKNESASFDISRDKEYIIPFIKDIMAFTNNECKFLASPWSPPKFMKTNNSRILGGKLKKEYYDAYADYLINFVNAYKNEGIDITYLTIQNEQKATQTWESCLFALEDEIEFAKILKSHLDNKKIDIKLLAWDHNKERMISRGLKALDSNLFDGIAYHWYSGDHFDTISLVRQFKKDTILFETEFCRSTKEDYVDSKYSLEYLNNINRGSNGLIEWNVLLDSNGGPYHNRMGGCDAPIRLNNQTKLVDKSEYYNEVFMFTNFIEIGSKSLFTSTYNERVKVCATKNKNGRIVINIMNDFKNENVKIVYEDKLISLKTVKGGLYTIILGE